MSEPHERPVTAAAAPTPDVPTELSMRRTGMSFQRTRLSADRTMMSVVRTSLSLITFGFTIFKFFQHLEESSVLKEGTHAARHFGLALVMLGVGMLGFGIAYQAKFMIGLRRQREELKEAGLIHGSSDYPVSLSLIVAVVLLLIGLLAIAGIAFNLGPF